MLDRNIVDVQAFVEPIMIKARICRDRVERVNETKPAPKTKLLTHSGIKVLIVQEKHQSFITI